MPKTTLFNMLRVLQGARYVENEGGAWRLGPEAVSLAGMITDSSRRAFPDCAMPLLQALSRRTGETVFLAELSGDKRQSVYIAAVETDNWLRFNVKVGTQRPAYSTGSGQAMLAFLPRDELAAATEGLHFDRITSRTISSRRAPGRTSAAHQVQGEAAAQIEPEVQARSHAHIPGAERAHIDEGTGRYRLQPARLLAFAGCIPARRRRQPGAPAMQAALAHALAPAELAYRRTPGHRSVEPPRATPAHPAAAAFPLPSALLLMR